jgi:hypothetical protein
MLMSLGRSWVWPLIQARWLFFIYTCRL